MQSCEEKPPTRDRFCIETWNSEQDLENRNEDILGTQDKSGEVGTPAGAGKAWFMEGQRSSERAKPDVGVISY